MSTLFQGTKIMTRTTQFLSRMLVLLFAAVIGLNAATAQSADPYKFEKKAYKPDGTPWSGPVNVGDTVKYVLSYKPGATNSGPVTIDDTLSPNQTYVAPTQGPGWTWGASPYSTGNHEQYVNPGFGPGTGSVKLTVTGLPKPISGSGDGTIPIPVTSVGKVFGVYHHASAIVDCWNLADLSKCGGTKSGGAGLLTPLTPQSVVHGSKFFFPAYRSGTSASFGCFDAASNSACPDTPVSANVNNYGEVGGVVEDGLGRLFIAVKEKVFCMTESGGTLSPCGGVWPVGGLTSVTTSVAPAGAGNDVYLLSEFSSSPTKIYIHHGNAVLQCIETATATPCAGWTNAGYKVPSKNKGTMLSSLPASGGVGDGGVCLWEFAGSLVGCVGANGAAMTISGVTTVNSIVPLSSLRIPNTGKVLFPDYEFDGPECYNFSGTIATPCSGFPIAWPAPYNGAGSSGFQVNGSQYGFAVDPIDPQNCVLALGHENMLWRLNHTIGEAGCGDTSTVSTPPIDQLYCNGAPDPTKFQWSSVNVTTPSAAGVLTIKQGGTTATVTLTSGTTNYAMPATIAPGSGPLTFSFAPTAGSPSSIDLVVGFTSDKNPEICYQAKVYKCGPVFNDAVFKGNLNGAPINVAQKVDLGVAKGPECDIPPPPVVTCLKGDAKVTCGEKPGTYVITLATSGAGGVTPTSVSITPTTAGVTIVNPQSSYPVIGGLVKIVVAGANPGDVLTFDMEGTTAGAGSVAGTDLCCNGTIKVTIPKDIQCKQPDISILKTGPKTCVPGQPCTFNITITNNGAPYNGNVLLWDQVSPNAWPVTAITPNVCGTSITTTPFSCVANLNLAANQSMTFTVTMTSSFNGTLVNENCIGVAYAPSWLSPNTSYSKAELAKLFAKYGSLKKQGESCWKVEQGSDKVDLAIKKTGATTPAPASPFYSFKMDVTNEGPAYTAAAGVLTVTDTVPAGMTFTSVTGTAGWSCAPNTNVPQGTLITCTYAGGALSAGPAAPAGTINISATANGAAPFPPFENCADVALSPTSGATDAVAANNKSCVTVTKKPLEGKLTVTKEAQVNGSHYSGQSFPITVTCGTNTASGVIQDGGAPYVQTGLPIGASCSVVETVVTPPASLCQPGWIASWKTTYVPATPVIIPAGGASIVVRNDLICNPPPPTGSVDVTKVCDPLKNSGPVLGPVASMCHITVTTTGPQTGTIDVSDSLVGVGTLSGATAPAPWTCSGSGCTVNGSALNQTSSTSVIDVLVTFPNAGHAVEAKNCPVIKGQNIDAKDCVTFTLDNGRITVIKEALYNGGHITSHSFPIALTCGGVVTNVNIADGTPYVQTGLPVNAACSVVENTSNLPNLCNKIEKPIWTTTYNPTTPVAASVAGGVITITNKLECERIGDPVETGTFTLNKEALFNGEHITNQAFTVNVTCGNTAQQVQVSDGAPYVQTGIPVGTDCDVSEIPAPVTALCPQGQAGKWLTTYAPNEGVTVPATGATITITNKLECSDGPPKDSQIYVKKVVVNNAPSPVEPLQFPFTANCTDANGQAWVAGTYYIADGQSKPVFGYEPGRACTVNEGTIPATAACGKLNPVWSTTYAPSQTAALSPNGETITVTNTLNCEPIADPKLSTFSVSKKASYNGEPILGTPFQMNVTCDDGTAQSLAVLSGQSQTINGLPVGTTCNVVEGKIGTTNLCPKGSVEKWATTYNPANGSNTTAANSSVVVRVDNLLTCEPIVIDNPLVCDPAPATNAGDLCRCRFDNMQQVSKTSCECKDGYKLNAGKGCVPIVVMPKCDPATTVTKGNACVCEYRNMVQVSKTACACAKGFKFAAGKGCFKSEPVCKQGQRFQPARNRCEPVCAKGFEYSVKRNTCNPVRVDCPKGTVYNAKRNRCDKAQPVCRPPFVYNAKIDKCVEQVQQCGRGEIKIGGKCRKIPNCPFGQIPIPGTGICVSIGGGGGGGPKDDNPKCVPQPGRECL